MKKAVSFVFITLSVACMSPLVAGEAPAAPSSAFSRSEDGARIYQTYCFQCHGTGFSGAPIANDADAWASRIAAGYDALLMNSKQGLNSMPAMGTCASCTDEELKAAIAEMLQFE